MEAIVNNPASISYIPNIVSYIPKKTVNQLFFRRAEGKRLGICPRVKLRYDLFDLGPTRLLIDRIKERADLLCQVQGFSFDYCKNISSDNTNLLLS